jgi:hypothetical protein
VEGTGQEGNPGKVLHENNVLFSYIHYQEAVGC